MPLPSIGTGGPSPMPKDLVSNHESGSCLTFDSRSLANANRNSITLKPADRRRLKVLARDRNARHKYVWRVDLFSADTRAFRLGL